MGLSNERGMGDSSVIECVRSDQIESHASWTVDHIEAQRTNVVIINNN